MDVDDGFDVTITREGSARNVAEYSVASPHPDLHTCNGRCGGGERRRSLPLQILISSFFVIKSINSDEGHTLWYSLYVRTLWYKSTDFPLLPLLNLMYCVKVSLWTVKIFLA